MKITINQNENQNIKIGNRNIQSIGINNTDDNQLITLNRNSNNQNIGINQNTNQVIFIDGGGVAIGINDVLVNGVSVVSNNIAYVIVPTKTSELENNSGFITSETDPTVPSYIKTISLADINSWNNKQNALVSGTNIKTINNESLLGSGNIDISSGETYTAGDGINITENVISNTITSYDDLTDLPTIPTKTSDLNNDSDFVDAESLSEVAFTGSYNSLSDTPVIPSSTSDLINDSDYVTGSEVSTEIQTAIATKQDTLVSGTNIKTINNTSLLGNGNIETAVKDSDNNFSAKQTINNELKVNQLSQLNSIELGGNITNPYVDFHYNDDFSVDYTSRIIESSAGNLEMMNNLNVNGNLLVNNDNIINLINNKQNDLNVSIEGEGVNTNPIINIPLNGISGVWLIIAQSWGAVNDNAEIALLNVITSSYYTLTPLTTSSIISISFNSTDNKIFITRPAGSATNYKVIKLMSSSDS